MRVAIKFAVVLVLVLVVIRMVEGVQAVQRDTARLDAAIKRDARLLERMLKTSVRAAWGTDGRDRALDLIDAMNVKGHPIRLSWIPFEGENGLNTRLGAKSLAKLADGETVAVRRKYGEKGGVQHFFVPVDIAEADGAIHMAEMLEERSRYIRHTLVREVIAGSVVVIAGATAVIFLGIFLIGRPLSQLRARITRIGGGDLSDHLSLKRHDEFSALEKGLNEMCRKLSASRQREYAETEKRIAAMKQVRHMDRLTTIGRLASGLAHELGTPLNVISARSGMICDGTLPPGSEEIPKNATTIKEQADRMTQVIRHLLNFARQRPPKRIETDGTAIVRHAADLVSCLGYKATVHIKQPGTPSSHIAEMDPVQIQQVITNLIENALQAMPRGGDVIVTVQSVTAEPPAGIDVPTGRFLQLSVKDQGAGISEEHIKNVFDPFFTTKDVGRGTGLGLSIAYGIIREHGGWIDVASTVGEGSRFTVYLPQEELS